MADELKSEPKIHVMPERFLALTRGSGLPVAPASSPLPSAVPPAPMPQPSVPTPQGSTRTGAPALSTPPKPGGIGRSLRIGAIIAGVVLILGGAAAYLVLRSVPTPPAPVVNVPVADAPAVPPPTPTVNTAPEVLPPEPPVLEPPPVELPPPPPAPSPDRDTDGDGLTDAEELVLGTDVQLTDTDSDGYSDATEVANLYNPTGIAPQRLIETNLVFAYTHPVDGWSIYVPRQWAIAATDQEQRTVVVTMGVSGESVTLRDTGTMSEEGCPGTTKRGAPVCMTVTGEELRVPGASFVLPDRRVVELRYEVPTAPARYTHLVNLLVQSFATSNAR